MLAAAALAFALARSGSAERLPAPPAHALFGIVGDSPATQRLARFDPSTLRVLPGRVALAGHGQGWSFSPGRAELALGGGDSCAGKPASLRLVDLARMRTLGDVTLAAAGSVDEIAWVDGRHVFAVVGTDDCLATRRRPLVVDVDANDRRVVARTTLSGDVLGAAQAPGALVLLLAPHGRIGTARVAVVRAEGDLHELTLDELRAGRTTPRPDGYVSDVDQPGLAVDPSGHRAFVVPGGDRLAEIDLRTLRVSYHDLSEQRSWSSRLLGWLDSPALAKGSNGPVRQALWLGDGRLAVTGTDTSAQARDGKLTRMDDTAAGLELVDVHDWTYRRLSPAVSSVQLAGGLLLAEGWSSSYDGSTSRQTDAGLTAYSLDGHERYHVFGHANVSLAAAVGGRGYAALATPSGDDRTIAFDLETGRRGARNPTSLWQLLLGDPTPAVAIY